MLPFAMQAQDSWTVADGTTVHAGVPFDFYNTDASGTSFTAQMLYPATLISDMAGNTLSGITFYHNSTNSKTLSASTWTVKMGESSLSDLSAGLSTETLTTVYAGSLVFTSGIVTIEFDSPYTYTSGNLIVEISTVGASGNWIGPNSNNGFKGEDNVGYTYTTQTSPNHFAFLPKTTFTKAPSCFVATGLAVSAVTSESMTLSWTSDATSFDIYDMATHTLVGNSSTNSYTVEHLDANTAYTFGVVVDCGGGDYSDTVTVSGRTACADIETIPYTWTFEDGTANATPNCWTKVGSGTIQVKNSTTLTHNDSMYLDFRGATSNLIVLPPTSVEANTLQMKLWLRPEGNYPSCANFSVGYITNVADASTYTALSTFNYTEFVSGSSPAYAEKAVMFAAAPAGARMALRAEPTGTGYYWYVDDVTIEELPSCVPVSGLTVDATQTTSSSLTLTWTSDATSFVIVNMADSSQVGTCSTNSYTVDGLNANTAYTFGVVVDCGGEMSDTVTVSGRTACGIIASLPWTDDLESVPSGSNVMPYCWTRYNNLTSGNNNYPYNTSSSSYAHSGSRSLYFYWSTYGTYADTTVAILPQLDVTTYPMNGNQLSFYGRMSVASQSIQVLVGTMSDPEDVTTFTTSGTVTVSGATHTRYDVNLTAANATDAYAAIMVLKPTGSASLYIDDVMLHEAPSCAYITGLTVTGATAESISLSWVDGDNTDATYSVYRVTPSDTTLVASNIADSAYTVEDLDANTAYVFGVVANCAGGDAEMVVVSGRTACVAFTIDADNPFTEGFEGTTFPPDCWSIAHTAGSSTNTWIRNTSTSSVHTGSASAQLQDQSSGNKNNLVTPVLNIPEANGYQVSFWIYRSTTSYTNKTKEGVKVWVNTNPDTVGGTPLMHIRRSATQGEITEAATGWYQYSAVIPTSGEMYVIFEGISEYGAATYIDDIAIEVAPSCLAPTGLAVSNITGEGATLSWTSDAGSFVVYEATATDTTVYDGSVSDNSLELTDLLPNTAYTFGVAADCGGMESAVAYVSFTTPCATVAVPFTETFEAASTTLACWNQESVGTTATWSFGAGTSTNGISTAYEGSANARIQISSYTGSAKLISPVLDLGGAMAMQVKFAHVHSPWDNDIDDLNVLYRTSADGAWTTIASFEDGPAAWTLDSVTLPANTYQVAFEMVSSYGYGLGIDNVVFTALTEAPCFPVAGLTIVDSLTRPDTIVLSWENNGETVTILNMADTTELATSYTDNTFVVTNLLASTYYTFGVVVECGDDYSDTVTISGRTACDIIAVPHTWDFESMPAGNTPDCWTKVGAGNATIDVNAYGSNYAHEGTQCLRFVSATSNIIALPEFDADVNTLQMKLWLRPWNNTASSGNFEVGYMTDVEDATTFTALATYNYADFVTNGTVAYDMRTVMFGNAPAGARMALRAAPTSAFYYWVVDDVTVEALPDCVPVTNLTADSVTTESITLSWVSDGSSFVVLNMADTSVAATVTDTTATIENLTASTSYTFGVVNDCGSETSDTVLITVRTACAAIAIPYTENFEADGNFPCWTMVDCQIGSYSSTGLSTENAYTGSSSFRFWYNTNPPQYLISPELSGTEDGVQVSFMYAGNGSYTETFQVGYSTTTNDPTAFTWSAEVSATSADYQAYSVDYDAEVKYVAIKYTANDQWYLFIDSLVVKEMPSCVAVTNLAVDSASENSVSISWSGAAASYTVYKDGTQVATGITGTSYTFTGLTANTSYTFGVVANCTATDESEMRTIVGNTACGTEAIALPYTETFDVSSASRNCWTTFDADHDGYNWSTLMLVDEYSYEYTEANMMISESYNEDGALTPDNWLISPKIQTVAADTIKLGWTVYAFGSSTYAAEHYAAYVSTTTTDTSAFTLLGEWTLSANDNQGTRMSIDLTAYAGQAIYVAFRHFNCTDMFYMGIDSVVVNAVAGQAPVTPTYTVTVNVNDATMGHVDGVPTAAVDSGAVVNLTAVPESGYHFVSWSNGLTTAAISLIVTSDTTVTATFEANPANTYTVAVSVNDAAMGHVDGIPTEPVTAGTVVNLTAVADAGYHFVDWSNGLTTAAISITVTSDTTLVANFEADPVEPTYYTVTVVYDATMGTVDGIPTEPVTSDDEITLTARANEGYVFKGWVIGTDTMSTESTYTFNATADVTIEAVFAAKTGIADVDMANVKVYSVNDVIYVNGAEGHQVYLFDVNGRVLNHSAKAGEHVEFRVANTGVYLVKVGNAAAKRVVVAR